MPSSSAWQNFNYANSHHLQQVIPLELVLIPMEVVPTMAGQQGVAPCGNEV